MKTKTVSIATLTGPALDWAVAKCEGVRVSAPQSHGKLEVHFSATDGGDVYSPSTDWSQAGPIIERDGLTLTHQADRWAAQTDDDLFAYGPTPLIAAMRCYVASKLGDEVEIPEELT